MPPSAPVTGGPTPHPCEVGTSESEQKLTEASDQNARHPHDCTPAESRETPIVKPDKCTGGLAAFASSNKRPAHPVSTPAKVARKHPTCESHATVPCRPYDAPAHVPVVFPHEDDAQPGATKVLQGVGATDCKGLDGHVVHDTKRETDPPKLSLPNPIDTNDHGGFVNEAIMGTNHDDGLTQDMLQAVEIHERQCHEDTSTAHCIQVIRQDDDKPTFIKVAPHATVGTITVAEAKLGSLNPPICVNTCVGTRVLSAATTQPFQQIFLKEMAKYGSGRSHEAITIPPEILQHDLTTRLALLYRQEAFVADDEIAHYLAMLTATGQAIHTPVAIVPEDIEDEDLILTMKNWFAKAMLVAEGPCNIVTAIFAQHHWFPVGMKFAHGHVQISTTPGGYEWVKLATHDMGTTCSIQTIDIESSFPNDCGFQCVGWIMSFVFDPAHNKGQYRPVSPATAIAWRGLFEHHLIVKELADVVVSPTQFCFGGASGGDAIQQLQQLLQDHGVPKDQANDRANIILDKLGRSTVTKTMRSTHPWRELKQIANQCAPKLQLVLESELQAVIKTRTDHQQKFGTKQNKKKHAQQSKPPIQIAADDIGIPEGIFQDASGQPVHQKAIANIGPDARGVIVVHAQQAVPYLKFAQPVSKQGLALLVLDHHDPLMHGVGEEIRFPARFEKTSEPILISAKLVQLGASIVSRITPEHAVKVEEVHTTVIRVIMYRDEIDKKWETILDKPVKHLVEVVKLLHPTREGTSAIMDVWDRQWLNDKMERTRPAEASMFMASFRLECSDIADALKDSGVAGCYIEPRSSDGRSPDPAFRVIWLNKYDKQGAMIASQSTAVWTCIVRSGGRFGLRVSVDNAQKVHEQHKPMTPFLTSDQVMTYHVGPIPHGSNRSALNKLFQSWSWQARPVQPKHRTPDGKGVVWECQAICKPPFEVYQLEHADVLITEVQKKPFKPAALRTNIQASAKTMAFLKASDVPEAAEKDPWEFDDPWGQYHTPVKAPRKSNLAESNKHEDIDLIAAKVIRKLQPGGNQSVAHTMEIDSESTDSVRIQAVEDRMAKLEQTVQTNHAQQGKHVQDLASQIAQVQHNVDQQGKAFQAHLDDKLDRQLQQIEHLLAKRSRTE